MSSKDVQNVLANLHEEFQSIYGLVTFSALLSLINTFLTREYDESSDLQLSVSEIVSNNHFYAACFVVSIACVFFDKTWIQLIHFEHYFPPLRVTQVLEFVFLFLSIAVPYKGSTTTLHNIFACVGYPLHYLWHATLYCCFGTSTHHVVWFWTAFPVYTWIAFDTILWITKPHYYYGFFLAEYLGLLLFFYGNFLVISHRFIPALY